MRHSSGIRRQKYVIGPTFVGERVSAFLRRAHPDRTVDNVVADLAPWGIPQATVAKMLERQTAPGAILWLALIDAYGPEFLAAIHPAPLGWLRPALQQQEVTALRRDFAAMQQRLDRLA